MIFLIDCQDHLERASEMILSIGQEDSSLGDTYFPLVDDQHQALRWLGEFPTRSWLIMLEEESIGLIMVHSPMSPGIPDGFLETGTFIKGVHRGKGIATKAWAVAEIELRGTCTGLAGVPWETNLASINRLRKSGFKYSNRVWYQSATPHEVSGWCEVWVKELH